MLYPTGGYLGYVPARPDRDAVAALATRIDTAERPVIIAGNGVMVANAGSGLQALAETAGVAVATSYNAKGVIAETSDIAVGMLGTWGAPTANRAVSRADLVVMIGASMGPDYTRFRDPELIRPGEQTLVQVDIDPRNAGWVYPVDAAITGDAGDVIALLAEIGLSAAAREPRVAEIADLKRRTGYDRLPRPSAKQGTVHHADIIAGLQAFLGEDDFLTLDAGANRIWSTFGLRMPQPQQLLVPGGTGIMGWGPPAALAAKLVDRRKRVTCLAGDGGFMMTLQVVTTCVQEDADVVFLVGNNAGLGMVRDNLAENRIAVDFEDVDFAKTVEGLGGKGLTVHHPDEIGDALDEAHGIGGPVVIDAKVDPDASHHEAVDDAPL